MADILSGEVFAIGQQVTASRLNNHINGAQIIPGAITGKTPLGNGPFFPALPTFPESKVGINDQILVYDSSLNSLARVTIGDLFKNTISSYSPGPSFGSPGNGFTISPSYISPKGLLSIIRDPSEDVVVYTPRNWLTIGDTSYSNTNVKGFFGATPEADISYWNTVDFNSNVNFKSDIGTKGVYVNEGYQIFAPETLLQIPALNVAESNRLTEYRAAAGRAGIPYAENKSVEDLRGILCYDVDKKEIAFRDDTKWQSLASKEFVSAVVTDAFNGPVLKAMVVFSQINGLYTIHKEHNIDNVGGSGYGAIRVTFADAMDDIYYGVSVDLTNGDYTQQNINLGIWSVARGLTYVDVTAAVKKWSKSGGPMYEGVWSVMIWQIAPEGDVVVQPDE